MGNDINTLRKQIRRSIGYHYADAIHKETAIPKAVIYNVFNGRNKTPSVVNTIRLAAINLIERNKQESDIIIKNQN